MNVIQCDRCGKVFRKHPDNEPSIIPAYNFGCTMDLCEDCIKSFEKWLYTQYFYNYSHNQNAMIPNHIKAANANGKLCEK